MVRSIGVGGGGLPLASCILDGFQQRDLAGRAAFAIVAGEFGVAEFGAPFDERFFENLYVDAPTGPVAIIGRGRRCQVRLLFLHRSVAEDRRGRNRA